MNKTKKGAVPLALHLILATHGPLAKGFAESMTFILKPENPIHTICAFTEAPDPGAAFDTLCASIPETDTIVVMTDLVGGSVNKEIAQRLSTRRFHLIAGINLAFLLELAVADEAEIDDEFLRETMQNAQEAMTYVNDAVLSQPDEEAFF